MVIRGKSLEGLGNRTIVGNHTAPKTERLSEHELLEQIVCELNRSDVPTWLAKVVGMLQQNWATEVSIGGRRVIAFVSDTSGVFDMLEFSKDDDVEGILDRNGFENSSRIADIATPPTPPFHVSPHPNGPVYSSGRFWISGE